MKIPFVDCFESEHDVNATLENVSVDVVNDVAEMYTAPPRPADVVHEVNVHPLSDSVFDVPSVADTAAPFGGIPEAAELSEILLTLTPRLADAPEEIEITGAFTLTDDVLLDDAIVTDVSVSVPDVAEINGHCNALLVSKENDTLLNVTVDPLTRKILVAELTDEAFFFPLPLAVTLIVCDAVLNDVCAVSVGCSELPSNVMEYVLACVLNPATKAMC